MARSRWIWNILNPIVWDTDNTLVWKRIWMESISEPENFNKMNAQVMKIFIGLFPMVPKCLPCMAGYLTPGLSTSLGPLFTMLTLWYLVGYMCILELCQCWYGWWFVAWLSKSHHPNQCWQEWCSWDKLFFISIKLVVSIKQENSCNIHD